MKYLKTAVTLLLACQLLTNSFVLQAMEMGNYGQNDDEVVGLGETNGYALPEDGMEGQPGMQSQKSMEDVIVSAVTQQVTQAIVNNMNQDRGWGCCTPEVKRRAKIISLVITIFSTIVFIGYYGWKWISEATADDGSNDDSPSTNEITNTTFSPTLVPNQTPTAAPTLMPTTSPTVIPTQMPTISPTAAPTQMPTLSPISLLEDLGIVILNITAGSYLRGSLNGDADEQPVKEVTVDKFGIGRSPIPYYVWNLVRGFKDHYGYSDIDIGQAGTQAAMGRNTPDNQKLGFPLPEGYWHAVTNVNWNSYLLWLNLLNEILGLPPAYIDPGSGQPYRSGPIGDVAVNPLAVYKMLTRAQWEYAARGGLVNATYPWGNTINATVSNHDYDYNGTTPLNRTTAADTANGFGVWDCSSQVYIWLEDYYDATYYSTGGTNNPAGPPSGTQREIGSCAWSTGDYNCRAANRAADDQDFRSYSLGVRIGRQY